MPIPRRAGRAAAALAALLFATSCTSEPDVAAPPPTPEAEEAVVPLGLTVAVVLPPEDEIDDGVRRALEAAVADLRGELGPEIRSVTTYRPDAGPFVADLVTTLTERGTDLVCVLGSRARPVVTSAADLHPELRYCATPVTLDPDETATHIAWVEIRTAELGHVLGVTARSAAGEGPVGVILSGAGLHGSALRNGLLAGLDGAEVVEVSVTAELDASSAVERVLAAGARVVVIDGLPGAADAIEAAAAASATVLAPAAVVGPGTVAGRSVMTWRVDWRTALRHPIDLLLDADGFRPTSLGLAEEVIVVELGPAASAADRRAAEAAIQELLDGSRDPLAPAARGTPAAPPPDAGP
jgi:hypothetical protein